MKDLQKEIQGYNMNIRMAIGFVQIRIAKIQISQGEIFVIYAKNQDQMINQTMKKTPLMIKEKGNLIIRIMFIIIHVISLSVIILIILPIRI